MKNHWPLTAIIILVVINLVVYVIVVTNRLPEPNRSYAVEPDVVASVDELLNSESTSTATDTNTSVTDTTTTNDRQTVSSSMMGIGFTLPTGFTESQSSDESIGYLAYVTYDEANVLPTGGPPPGIKLEINQYVNEEETLLFDWVVENVLFEGPEVEFENVTVGNTNGLFEETLTIGMGTQTTYVSNDSSIFIIYVVGERETYDERRDDIQAFVDSLTFG